MTTEETVMPPAARPRQTGVWLAILVLLAAFSWLAWSARQQQAELADLRTARSAVVPPAAASSVAQALTELNQRLQILEQQQGATQEERQAASADLSELLQKLRQGREEIALFDIEQSLALATQQLQLAGNTPLALVALNTADRQLADLDNPRFVPLRKALAADIARLDALPRLDVTGISLRLEQLLTQVDAWPLAAHARPPQETPAAAPAPAADGPESTGWRQLLERLWQPLQGLVRIQRIEANTPVLLAPEQTVYLREQLKLRLLNARLALLAHEGEVFKGDIAAISDALPRFFAQEDAAVRAAIDYCRQLQALEISNERPELRSSLEALARLRNENRSGNSAAAAEVAP